MRELEYKAEMEISIQTITPLKKNTKSFRKAGRGSVNL